MNRLQRGPQYPTSWQLAAVATVCLFVFLLMMNR